MVSQQPTAHSVHLEKAAPASSKSKSKMATATAVGQSRSGGSTALSFATSLGSYFRRLLAYLALRIYECFYPSQVYREVPESPRSAARLAALGGRRKTLVLDLDETLVHSCNEDFKRAGNWNCGQVPEGAIPDYVINVALNGTAPIAIRVFKRPHVDFFLSLVSKWYDLVIYTASTEAYAAQVVDRLDGGRGLLTRRLYRQHCRPTKGRIRGQEVNLLCKDLTRISKDLRGTLIVDNSPHAYRHFPDNALPIKTFVYDPSDTELLKLLPFLDALRFTRDVRSVLGRRARR